MLVPGIHYLLFPLSNDVKNVKEFVFLQPIVFFERDFGLDPELGLPIGITDVDMNPRLFA
jgi:hypothetical protein